MLNWVEGAKILGWEYPSFSIKWNWKFKDLMISRFKIHKFYTKEKSTSCWWWMVSTENSLLILQVQLKSNSLHKQINSMFRFNNQSKSRGMSVCRWELEEKLGKDEGQNHLQLCHSQVLADTDASPYSKGNVCLRKLASSENPMLESFRIELVGIRTPKVGVLMQYRDRDLNVYSFRYQNVFQLNILQRFPWNKHPRWVKA